MSKENPLFMPENVVVEPHQNERPAPVEKNQVILYPKFEMPKNIKELNHPKPENPFSTLKNRNKQPASVPEKPNRNDPQEQIQTIFNRINPGTATYHTAIIESTNLIQILRQNANSIAGCVSCIARETISLVKQTKNYPLISCLALLLSRTVSQSHFTINQMRMFLNEFSVEMPSFRNDYHGEIRQDQDSKYVHHFILLWLSYDPTLVRTVSMPMIQQILNKGSIRNESSIILTFINTTAFAAKEFCPDLLRQFFEMLRANSKELGEHKKQLERYINIYFNENRRVPYPSSLYAPLQPSIPSQPNQQSIGSQQNRQNIQSQPNQQSITSQQNQQLQIGLPTTNVHYISIGIDFRNKSPITDDQLNDFINQNPDPFIKNHLSKIIGFFNPDIKNDAIHCKTLIQFMRAEDKKGNLQNIIPLIAAQFIHEATKNKDNVKNTGLSYALFRIVQLANVGDNAGLDQLRDIQPPPFGMFLKEFLAYIPWLDENYSEESELQVGPKLPEYKSIFHMVLLWFSYDERLVRHLSMSIIHHILAKNDLINHIDLIDIFIQTTSFAAYQFCPELLDYFYIELEKQYNEQKAMNSHLQNWESKTGKIKKHLELHKNRKIVGYEFPPKVEKFE